MHVKGMVVHTDSTEVKQWALFDWVRSLSATSQQIKRPFTKPGGRAVFLACPVWHPQPQPWEDSDDVTMWNKWARVQNVQRMAIRVCLVE